MAVFLQFSHIFTNFHHKNRKFVCALCEFATFYLIFILASAHTAHYLNNFIFIEDFFPEHPSNCCVLVMSSQPCPASEFKMAWIGYFVTFGMWPLTIQLPITPLKTIAAQQVRCQNVQDKILHRVDCFDLLILFQILNYRILSGRNVYLLVHASIIHILRSVYTPELFTVR